MLGARPLRRTIQREIEDSLSEKILFGELRPGQIVIVDTEGSGETAKFTFTACEAGGRCRTAPRPEIATEPVVTKSGAVGGPASGPGTARTAAAPPPRCG